MSLNNDIYLLIFEHLHDQKDKLNFLRVCRDWYTIFFQEAYNTISMQEDDQIYRLVRSAQENPKIGSAIKHVDLQWSSSDAEPYYEYDADTTIEIIRKSSPGHQITGLEYGLRKGSFDAWFAVFLLSLDSVRTMRLQFQDSEFFLNMVASIVKSYDQPSSRETALQNLERVDIWLDDNKDYYQGIELLPFFLLPAIRGFTADGVCELYSCDPSETKRFSSIKELDLGGSNRNNGANGFASYIGLCANLEIFDYQHDNKGIWGQYYCDFCPLLFYKALCSQKNSLRVLRLNDCGENDKGGYDEIEGADGFGSLVDFHQLRELRIPLRVLLQFGSDDQPKVSLPEILPSSLEFLNLADYGEEDFAIVMKDLRALLAQRERFPNLRRIELQPNTLVKMPGGVGGLWTDYVAVQKSTQDSFLPFEKACQELEIQFGFSKGGHCRVLQPEELSKHTELYMD